MGVQVSPNRRLMQETVGAAHTRERPRSTLGGQG